MTSPLFIRADASTGLGTGHVMRMLALAQAWRDAGPGAAGVVFVCAEIPDGLADRLVAEGCAVERTAAAAGSREDAAETLRILARHGAAGGAWLVADGYRFGLAFQRAIRTGGFRLLVVDDNAENGAYDCDAILNQNPYAARDLYPVGDATPVLAGSRFALLRREFVRERSWMRVAKPRIEHVLVFLGGGDPDNETTRVLAALRSLGRGYRATALAGAANPHRAALEEEAARWDGRCRLLFNATDMPALMKEADAAVAGAGSACWEMMYLGLPPVLTVLAENQRRIAEELQARDLAVNLGPAGAWSAADLGTALDRVLGAAEARADRAARGSALVDGCGAARVAALLGAPLRISVVSDESSWIRAHLPALCDALRAMGHRVEWKHDAAETSSGDLAFYLSYGRLVKPDVLRRFAHNLVVHESDLPKGRGWSPLTWQILEGKNRIPATLFEAEARVDAGPIYAQQWMEFCGDELVDELRAAQAQATLALCSDFVRAYPRSLLAVRPQEGESTHYPRRRPEDSRLDPEKTLADQFNLLRVVDNERYPAYFEHGGRRYELHIRRR